MVLRRRHPTSSVVGRARLRKSLAVTAASRVRRTARVRSHVALKRDIAEDELHRRARGASVAALEPPRERDPVNVNVRCAPRHPAGPQTKSQPRRGHRYGGSARQRCCGRRRHRGSASRANSCGADNAVRRCDGRADRRHHESAGRASSSGATRPCSASSAGGCPGHDDQRRSSEIVSARLAASSRVANRQWQVGGAAW